MNAAATFFALLTGLLTFGAATVHAQPSPGATASAPASVRAAASGCPLDDEVRWAGPFDGGGGRHWVAVAWAPGADRACLVHVRRADGALQTSARWIEAGQSQRYGERYAPRPLAAAVGFVGPSLVFAVQTTAMGHGGGGGDLFTFWRASSGGLRRLWAGTIAGHTDINRASASPCRARDHGWRLHDGVLTVRTCFDGEPASRWRVDVDRGEVVELKR